MKTTIVSVLLSKKYSTCSFVLSCFVLNFCPPLKNLFTNNGIVCSHKMPHSCKVCFLQQLKKENMCGRQSRGLQSHDLDSSQTQVTKLLTLDWT